MYRLVLVFYFLILTGCSTPKNDLHTILGSDSGWEKSSVRVVQDVSVSGLRVRVTQRLSGTQCIQGARYTLELDGPINKDTVFVLTKILEGLPKCILADGKNAVHNVYLNSGGGTLEDGYAIGRLFRKVGVTAVVGSKQVCASSCAVAFLGATFRHIEFDGLVVFHAPYREIDSFLIECAKPNDDSAKLLRAYYLAMIGSSGERLFERTMDFCSRYNGWTVDSGAAKIFGITR